MSNAYSGLLFPAVLKDFDLIKPSVDIVRGFLASPVGRTKDVISNLFVLIGYIAALPHEHIREIFGQTAGTMFKSYSVEKIVYSSVIIHSYRIFSIINF